MDLVESCTTKESAAQAIHWCVGKGVEQLHVLNAMLQKHFRFRSHLSDIPDLCIEILLKVIEAGSDDLLSVILPHVSDDFLSEMWAEKACVNRLLCKAVENGHSKIVRLLGNRGGYGGVNSSYRGKPILHLAVMAGNFQVAEELLAAGADVMATDVRGHPLMTSVIIDSSDDMKEEKVEWLLKNGADPRRKAPSAKEPIHVAAAHSGLIIEHLVKAGCDVNTLEPINGDSPLHISCARCCEDAIFSLIRLGAKFNLPNTHGETPLEKLLKFAQNDNSNFHAQTRINLAKSLVKIGFKILPKKNKLGRVGRNKVVDIYKNVIGTVKSTGSLQHLCRLKVREEVKRECFEKSVASLEIPKLIKDYLKFKDCVSRNVKDLLEG